MGHGGGLDAARDFDALGSGNGVGVFEIQRLREGVVGTERIAIGEAGEGIDAGDLCEADGA